MFISTRPDSRRRTAPIPPRLVLSDPLCLAGFGLGAGLSPWAPGTLGTLMGLPLYWLMQPLGLLPYLGMTALLFLIGIPICRHCETRLKVSDHSGIVWDEIVGYLITMTAAPASWQGMLTGFLLFRVFDIIKPWPIRSVDRRLHGGLGIMLDDALAGVFAAIVLHGLLPGLIA